MKRREFITLVSGAAAWPLATRAQQPKNKKIPLLCFLTFDPETSRSTRFGAFFQALGELGYVDGPISTIDYLSAEGVASGFRPSLPNVCDLRRTSSP